VKRSRGCEWVADRRSKKGRGGSAGRGQRGQKSRSGPQISPWFEGGQTPLHRRIPKRGFNNVNHQPLEYVNIEKVLQWIKAGRIDWKQPITMKVLRDSGCVTKKIRYGVKLLANGYTKLKDAPGPLHFEVTYCSKRAKEAIEAAGGSVKLIYLNRNALRAHLMPEKFERLPPMPSIPPPRLRYRYRDQQPDGLFPDEVPRNYEDPAFDKAAAAAAFREMEKTLIPIKELAPQIARRIREEQFAAQAKATA